LSSKIFTEVLKRFKSFTPLELKALSIVFNTFVQHNEFNLDDLVKAKHDDNGIKCPHCSHAGPEGMVKYGKRREVQWYKCKLCGRTFSAVTGTFLNRTKKFFQDWEDFIQCMMEGYSVRKTAEVCKIHRNTAWAWRHKILDALSQYQNSQPQMKGVVEADDTFFPLSFKGSTPVGRKPHQRGEKATKRGTSREKVCVSCAVERDGQLYSKVSALGRAKEKDLQAVFRKRFSRRAVVCTDNDRAYVKFGKHSRFTHFRVPNGIRVLDIYHVQNINSYHSRLKAFMTKFKGVATKYLNNYLVWMNLIQEGKRSKVELLKLAIKALVFDRWVDLSCRSAVPVPVTVTT